MQSKATFVAALMLVAALAYGLGRKHGASMRDGRQARADSQVTSWTTRPSRDAAGMAGGSPETEAPVKRAAPLLDPTLPFAQNALEERIQAAGADRLGGAAARPVRRSPAG